MNKDLQVVAMRIAKGLRKALEDAEQDISISEFNQIVLRPRPMAGPI